MAARKTMRQEIEQLQAEQAELRADRDQDRRRAPQPLAEAAELSERAPAKDDSAFGTSDLEQAIRELAEATESEISERPFTVVGLAFLLGFILGRLSRT